MSDVMSAKEKIRKYIESLQKDPCSFTDADDLIENRLIDSLQFMDFVLYIEELSGKEISMEGLNIEDFRSVDKIAASFFLTTSA